MLWNRRFLFLHYPKTAGVSLTEAFAAAWERPVFGIVAPGQLQTMRQRNDELVFLTTGSGHESLARAHHILSTACVDMAAFEAIFVVVRNPYDLMVSNYFFMRRTHASRSRQTRGAGPEHVKFRFAAEADFASFCERIPMSDISGWMTLDGRVPDNLEIIRFEALAENFARIGRKYGMKDVALPRRNVSRHDAYQAYMTPDIEEAIHRKLPYLFDQGFYSRDTVA
jgi:hypothetical protein